MEEKEKNFFKKVWTSIRDFEGYEEFAAEKLSKSIIYIAIITLIFVFVVSFINTYNFGREIQDVKNYISNNIDEISMIDGKLKIEPEKEIVIIDEKNIIPAIIVNTKEDTTEQEYDEKLKPYNLGMLLLDDKIVFKSSLLEGAREIPYSAFFTTNIENKGALLELISNKNLFSSYVLFFITVIIYLFIIYISSNLLDIIILGALGYLFARIMKIRLKYKAAFSIGTHALTLPIILNLIYVVINTYTGFTINNFQWMYTTISYIYVVVAILMIKTEIINQRIQLIRLRRIQEKVSEENEEAKEKEGNPKEEKKEEKPNEEEKEKTSGGEEPEGSNA